MDIPTIMHSREWRTLDDAPVFALWPRSAVMQTHTAGVGAVVQKFVSRGKGITVRTRQLCFDLPHKCRNIGRPEDAGQNCEPWRNVRGYLHAMSAVSSSPCSVRHHGAAKESCYSFHFWPHTLFEK